MQVSSHTHVGPFTCRRPAHGASCYGRPWLLILTLLTLVMPPGVWAQGTPNDAKVPQGGTARFTSTGIGPGAGAGDLNTWAISGPGVYVDSTAPSGWSVNGTFSVSAPADAPLGTYHVSRANAARFDHRIGDTVYWGPEADFDVVATPPPPVPQPISCPGAASGFLTSASGRSTQRGQGFDADQYTFQSRTGKVVTVATSSPLDTYLYLLDGSGHAVAQDDDSGGNHNARIVYTVPADGSYTVEVTTYAAGSTGAYTLTLGCSNGAAPAGLTATAGYGQVSLSWTGAAGASSYNVYRGTTSGGPYAALQSGLNTTSATDAAVSDGTAYYYVVTAAYGAGEGDRSAEATATPGVAIPVGLTAVAGNSRITLSWGLAAGASSYNVYRGTAAGAEDAAPVRTGVVGTSCTDAGLTDGTTYFYRVTAVSASREGSPSGEASAVPFNDGLPAGAVAWLKADALTGLTSGGPVSTWADASGSGNDASAAAGQQPTWIDGAVGGKPAVHFDGSNSYFSLPAGMRDFTQGLSAFVVVKPTSSASWARFFDFGNGLGSDNVLWARNGTSNLINYGTFDGGSAVGFDTPNALLNDVFQVLDVVQQGGSPGGVSSASLYRNGPVLGSGTAYVPNVLTRANNYVGKSNWPADALFQGDIAELILYNTALSDADRRSVETYLSLKYGLPLTDPNVLFSTGFESGDPQPTWVDSVYYSNGVSGPYANAGPLCSPRQEAAHSGASALVYAGTANGGTPYCYYQVYQSNIPVTAATKLSYWIDPQQDNGRYAGVDLHCTDGTTLRDSGAVDQNGISVHPCVGHGGNIPLNAWTQIKCAIGQYLAGKTVDRILVGYDRYGGPPTTGPYRGYIDDILITNGTLPDGSGPGGSGGSGGSGGGSGTGGSGSGGGSGAGGGTVVTEGGHTVVYQVDAGGGAAGSYLEDQYFDGGAAAVVGNAIDVSAVTDPAPQAVYQSTHHGGSVGTFHYVFPNLTPGASYVVRLHFCENYWSQTGCRSFNVAVNGATVLANFDIFATAGGQFKAVALRYDATADGSGQITVGFSPGTVGLDHNPSVNGLEVLAGSLAGDPPDAPAGLVAASASGGVQLVWNPSDRATSYNVYRGAAAGAEDAKPVASGLTSPNYTDAAANSGTFYYQVTAVNANGESGRSNEASATFSLAAPTGVSATPGDGAAYVEWDAVAGAAYYQVFRAESGGNYGYVGDAGGTAFTNSGLTVNTAYTYIVRAVSNTGVGPFSDPAALTLVLPAPQNVRAVPGDGTVNLTWDALADADYYQVFRSDAPGGPYGYAGNTGTPSYTDGSRVVNHPYYYVVRAVNNGGVGPYSQETGVTLPLPAPQGVQALPGDGVANLTWDPVPAADYYQVFRAGADGNYGYVGNTGTPNFTNSGLSVNTDYSFQVRAINNGGPGPFSDPAPVTLALPAPQGIQATPGDGVANLSWTAEPAADYYQVFRATTPGGPYQYVGNTGGTAFTNSGLTANTAYYYVVRAVNNGGVGPYSDEVPLTLGLPAPQDVLATPGDGVAALSWSAVPAADYYQVFRSDAPGGPYGYVGNTGTAGFTNSGLTINHPYYYVVRACNNGGVGPYSDEVPLTLTLPAPLGVRATPGESSVSLSWAVVPAADYYQVFRSDSSGANYGYVGNTGATSFVDGGLTDGHRYYYVVRAVNNGGAGPYSDEVSAAPGAQVLGVPTGLTATPGDGQVALSWTGALGATGYNVKRALTSGGPYTTITSAVAATGYTDVGLSNGTGYYYVVTAVSGGNESAASNEASATPASAAPQAPAAPSGLRATAGDAQVTLAWAASAGASSYNLYRGTAASGEGSAPYRKGLTSTSFTDAGLTDGTTYYYVVTASSAGAESPASNEASAMPVSALPAPSGLAATAANGHVTLSWHPASGAASYDVKRGTTSGGPYAALGTAPGTTYTDGQVSDGTTYYYVVSAVGPGGEGPDSGEASVTATLKPAAPADLAAVGGNRRVSLSWSGADGATSYNVKRSATDGGPYAVIAADFAGTSYVDAGVPNGTPYSYVVSGVSAHGEGPDSNPAKASGTAGYSVSKIPVSPYMSVKAINNLGQFLVQGPFGPDAYGLLRKGAGVWQNGAVTEVHADWGGFYDMNAAAFNDAGQVVGAIDYTDLFLPQGWNGPTGDVAFSWSAASGFTHFGVYGPAFDQDPSQWSTFGGNASRATAINSRGQFVGSVIDVPDQYDYLARGYIWSDGSANDLGGLDDAGLYQFPATHFTTPFAINDTGRVVGSSSVTNGYVTGDDGISQFLIVQTHAFLWQDGSMLDLDPSGASIYSAAYAINDAGTVVGEEDGLGADDPYFSHDWTSTETPHAMVWDAARGMRDLGTLGGPTSRAVAVSASGEIVGTSDTAGASGTQHAFVCFSGGPMQDLNGLLPAGSGWVLKTAIGINDRGQIIGMGTYNGTGSFYILNPAPGAHPLWQGNKPIDCPCNSSGGKKAPGPSKNDPVNLATGAEEYAEDPDLSVYNPVGPAVTFQRNFDSGLAAAGVASPGLSAGWTHNYDYAVQGPAQAGVWGPLTLLSPNGAQETWTPVLDSGGRPTGDLTSAAGTPYLVHGVPGATAGQWDSVTLSWGDQTQWQFTPSNGAYVLGRITSRTGQSLDLDWNAARALTTVSDTGSGTTLLTLGYDANGNLSSATDVYGRQVFYTFAPVDVGGASPVAALTAVSELVPSGTTAPPTRWAYGYAGYGGQPLLHGISVPSPTGTGTSMAAINYVGDMVSSLVDANGVQHAYVYGPSSTQVQVLDKDGKVADARVQSFSADQYDTGSADATGASPKIEYADPANPSLPTHVVDKNGKEAWARYDAYGNPVQTKSGRGVVTAYAYDYAAFPLGRLTGVQEGSKAPTTFTYYEPTGLVHTATGPAPGTIGAGATVTTSYAYDGLGNVLSVTSPGNNAVGTMTTAFDYTTDAAYDAGGAAIPAGQPAYTRAAALGQPLTVTDSLGKTSHLRYDARGNVVKAIDPLGRGTDSAFAFNDLPLSVTLPATGQTGPGRGTVVSAYQSLIGGDPLKPYGPLVSTTTYDEGGAQSRQVTLAYGPEGELLSLSGSTEPVGYAYDALYRLIALTDGNRHTTRYSFDPAGNLARIDYPGGEAAQFPRYDAEGNLLERIDGRGIETDYVYNDPESLLTDVQYPASSALNVHYAYDGYGRPLTVTDGTGTRSVGAGLLPGYDDLDDVLNVQTAYTGLPPQLLSYGYYPDGSRQSMTTPAGTFSYQYDGGGRLTGLTNPFQEASSWGYYDDGRLRTRQLGDGAVTSYAYDALGELTDLANRGANGTLLSEFSVPPAGGYDGAGNRTALSVSVPAVPGYGGQTSYAYDAKDQLRQEQSTRNGGYTNAFDYDGAGNPATFRGQGPHAFNANNQHADAGFTYDDDGNPVSYKGVSLSFDPEDRLTGGGSLSAGYTAEGLRAWKQGAAGAKTFFLYDGDTPVAELDAQGGVAAVNTTGADGLLSRRTGGGSTFYTFDPQGGTVQRLGGGGAPLSTSLLDAYGLGTGVGDASGDPYAGFGAQWGYYTDAETGLELLTHRYYDPAAGRFVTRDPIGYSGGINLYAYTTNNPINSDDPEGFSGDDDDNAMSYLGNIFNNGTAGDWWNILKNNEVTRAVTTLADVASYIPDPANPEFDIKAAEIVAEVATKGRRFGGITITGYTKHGLNQAIGRNGGRGVNAEAILDTLRFPKKVACQSSGTTKIVGKKAIVIISAEGKIITVTGKARGPRLYFDPNPVVRPQGSGSAQRKANALGFSYLQRNIR